MTVLPLSSTGGEKTRPDSRPRLRFDERRPPPISTVVSDRVSQISPDWLLAHRQRQSSLLHESEKKRQQQQFRFKKKKKGVSVRRDKQAGEDEDDDDDENTSVSLLIFPHVNLCLTPYVVS